MVGIFLLSLSGSSDFSFFAFLLTVCCLGQVQVFAQYACTVQLIRAPCSLICCLLLSYCFPCATRASSPSLSFLTRLIYYQLIDLVVDAGRCILPQNLLTVKPFSWPQEHFCDLIFPCTDETFSNWKPSYLVSKIMVLKEAENATLACKLVILCKCD